MLRHVELASFGLDHGTVVGLEVVWGYRDAGDCRRCHAQGDRKKNAAHDVLRCPGAVTLDGGLPVFMRLSGETLDTSGSRRVPHQRDAGWVRHIKSRKRTGRE